MSVRKNSKDGSTIGGKVNESFVQKVESVCNDFLELSQSAQHVNEALARRELVDTAIARTASQKSTATARIREIKTALPDMQSQLALVQVEAEIDSTKALAAESLQTEIDALTREVVAAETDLARVSKTIPLLYDQASQADAGIAAARSEFVSTAAVLREQLQPLAVEAIREAVKPLAEVMQTIRVIGQQLPGGFLDQYAKLQTLIDPESMRVNYATFPETLQGTNLLNADAVETVALASPNLESAASLVRALRAHRPFTLPSVWTDPFAAPYEVKGQSKADQARTQEAPEWTPPKSTWQRSRTDVRDYRTPLRPAADLNVVNGMTAAPADGEGIAS